MSMGFGLMLATVGTDLVTGVPRYTCGIPYLLDGIDFVVVVIGLFAISEVLISVEEARGEVRVPVKLERIWLSMRDFTQSFWAIIRGSVIGFYIGLLPSPRAPIASFLSSRVEDQVAQDPSTFGKGDIRGVASP